jgi:hypothetical protein
MIVPTRARPAGFSVLELMVAMTIGLAMLTAVWAMFGLFSRQQEADLARTSEAQIIRGLHQALSRDLMNVVPPNELATPVVPPAASPGDIALFPLPGMIAPGDVRSDEASDWASLEGTRTRLSLLVFADAIVRDSDPSSTKQRGYAESISNSIDEPYQRVEYIGPPGRDPASSDFLERRAAREESGASGLSRCERAAVAPAKERESWRADLAADQAHQLLDRRDQASSRAEVGMRTSPRCQETVAEIRSIKFQYFDGRTWSEDWNSRETKSLPVAVRIRLSLRKKHDGRGEPVDLDLEKRDLPVDDSTAEEQPSEFDHEFILLVSGDAGLPAAKPILADRPPLSSDPE